MATRRTQKPAQTNSPPEGSEIAEAVKRRGAPRGNRFWEARTKHGRDKAFTPETLWLGAQEYFHWVDENPLWEDKVFVAGGVIQHEAIPKIRAMTIGGLCIYLGISRDTWERYQEHKDFSGVTKAIAEVIRDQKFTAASADLLNANIISRDLGLIDKKEVEQKVTVEHDFSALDDMDSDEIAAMSAMLDRAMAGKAVN